MEDSPACSSRADEGLDSINTLTHGMLKLFAHSMLEVIEGLVKGLGYTPDRLNAMPYDFRLTPDKLETRDGYFSRLKAMMEFETKRLGMRSVVLAHSLGCNIFAYFLKWLEAEVGPMHYLEWVDRHVAVYFANGFPLHGSVDIATPLMVGETQGIPISLKFIHEVLASAGGLTTLIPTHAPDVPWLVAEEVGEIGSDPCHGDNSALSFFERAAEKYNCTHMAQIASFVRRGCKDPVTGMNVFAAGVERPPIDTVHVAYGVGAETAIQTSFKTIGHSKQTPPYFEDGSEDDYPTVVWKVVGSKTEKGLKEGERSGDDTVQYSSLSAQHAWLGTVNVSAVSTPLRLRFGHSEIWKGKYDPEKKRGIYPDPPGEDDEPRLELFESTVRDERGGLKRTSLMEMHGVHHRGSAQHEVFVDYVVRQLTEHALGLRRKRDEGVVVEDLFLTDFHESREYLESSRDYEPQGDDDCVWSFSRSSCAYPSHCEYRYHVGDLTLSHSCRLKKISTAPNTDGGGDEL